MKNLWILMFLVGCGGVQRSCTAWTGELTYKCSKHHIEYVQSDSGIAVSLDGMGQPVKCEK